MVGPFPGVPYSFGALRKTFGPLFVRCDVCRRYARLYLAQIRDTDYRTKSYSCCRCGTDGTLAITAPTTETGMTDYQLDQVEGPQHHPAAVDRLTDAKACLSPVWKTLWGEGPNTLTADEPQRLMDGLDMDLFALCYIRPEGCDCF